MKQIPLTQGKVVIVDDEDYERLIKHKWYANWDRNTKGFRAMTHIKVDNLSKIYHISMSRFILGLKKGDKRQADHINHNTLDECKSNLRIVTCQQNQHNRKMPKGCYWSKQSQNWHADIKVNGKKIYYKHIIARLVAVLLQCRRGHYEKKT